MATILIVDDLSSNRKVLAAVLEQAGHQLLEAVDGSDGLALARANHPELVITDILMPVMDGYELVKQLRLDPATRTIPVLFYTAHYSEREARALARSTGVSYVLTKPVEPREVLRIIDRVLAGGPEPGTPMDAEGHTTEFDREHLRLMTDELSGTAGELRTSNARLRALINIGLELASERDPDRLLHSVCMAARDLFGATYVTLGILDLHDRTVQHVISCGTDVAHWTKPGDPVSGILGTVVSEGRTMRGDNPDGDPTRLELPSIHPAVQAFLAAPIVSPTQVYGWICFVGNEGRTFSADDENLVKALSGQVGRIYENTYFAAIAEKRANALEQQIQERKEAELALRVERDRAQEYLETAEVILLKLDLDARIVLVNRYACSVLGWAEDELIGQKWIEKCLPASIRDELTKRFHDLLGGDLSVVENPVLTRSGEERLIEWRNRLLRDDQGRIIGTFSSGIDITERTRAMLASHVSDALKTAILDVSLDCVVTMDHRGLVTEFNAAAERTFGYTRGEAIGRLLADLIIPPAYRERHRMGLEQYLATGKGPALGKRLELSAIRRDGTEFPVELAIIPLPVSGDPVFTGFIRDITDRKHAETELRHAAQLSALGAAVGLALTETDVLAPALQRCAEALVANLGAAFARIWTLNEREGMLELQASAGLYTHLNGPHGRVPVGKFKIGRIARDLKPHLTNAVVGDPQVNDQDWAAREGMVSFAGHPLIVEGRVVGVMALFARHALPDAVLSELVSVADHLALGIERLRNAQARRITEERMRFAFQSADVGIWDMDYVTGNLEWSEILEAQYGFLPGTFGGTFEAFVARVHPDDRDALVASLGEAAKAGTDFTTHHRTLWPDGTVRWLSGAGRIQIGENGEPVRGIGISMDVTERRALEEQYQQSQKMEAIGLLAGGVAHDFNNLLTAILGHCELLLVDLDPRDPHRTNVTKIQRAGTSAAALTRQLLSFSRKELIEPKLLDLNLVVTDMRAMLGRLIREDVKVVLALRSELAPVKADRGQLEQIVLNLAVNAQDAMPGGGTLTIETANVELDANYAKLHLSVQPGPYVMLTVADTGTGMTQQVQSRLFEPFFTTKEIGKGTGLGLATVHGIVARCGGSIIVDTSIGRGSSFKVYFPAAAGATDVEAPQPLAQARAVAKTVLVVEDAEGVRELTRSLLQRQGYTVLVAANAHEALVQLDQNASIDVVLADVVMPGGSGPELAKWLLELRPSLKVVYMSGYTEEAIVHHGVIDAGIVFLHKPFTSEALGRKIREALEA